MNTHLKDLFDHNRAWAAQMVAEKPNFFTDLLAQQSPRYMWIGCSDSRVPANQITGLAPGEVFVHRNVANVVVPTDLNCLSTIQYAVDMLKVEHLMVVGHYGCGGVQAALNDARVGLADNWLRHIKDVRDRHAALLERLPVEVRHDALCELNVIEQVVNVQGLGRAVHVGRLGIVNKQHAVLLQHLLNSMWRKLKRADCLLDH